ncbi:hypothetical protein KC660_00705, partial [Candidatus Dojkabacteria bacterium]|nr:hypothetical protein [Candidatus Dojkabacteria bacterium]
FYKEGYGVLKLSMDCLKAQNFPTDQMTIVLATEFKHPPGYEIARKLKAEYEEYFADIWITQHKLVEGETAGKHSNMAHASKEALKKIRELGWDEKYITWTDMDSDSHFNRNYFSAMTYHFVTDPNRYINIYSAPMQYTANYDRLYFYGRANAVSTSFAGIANASREHHHIPISTYTASLELQKDIGFWDLDVIPEDAHNFFKALFLKGDEMRAVTIYLPTLADTAEGLTHKDAFINQYEQEKRWAYGASHHFKLFKMLKERFTYYKTLRLFNYLHFHYTWSWLGFILFFGSSMALMVNQDFSYTILGSNMSRISSRLFTSIIVLFVISILMLLSLIANKGKKSTLRKLIELVELMLLPVVRIFTSFAGLDAHTRLMLAKYMEYRVTEKIS